MRPVKNGGRWPYLTAHNTNTVVVVEQLDQEVKVGVRARKRFENGDWAFRLEGSEPICATVAEDLSYMIFLHTARTRRVPLTCSTRTFQSLLKDSLFK